MRSIASSLLLLCTIALFVGCGDGRPKRVPFSGQVLIDNQPLTTGTIMVIPDNERPATGQIGADGRFTLSTYGDNDGVVLGTHRVEIVARETQDGAIKHLTPRKYQDAATSGLTITVENPTSDYKLELSWEGEKPFIERTNTAGDVEIRDPS
jgi:hypothetical protein